MILTKIIFLLATHPPIRAFWQTHHSVGGAFEGSGEGLKRFEFKALDGTPKCLEEREMGPKFRSVQIVTSGATQTR